jgi:hypothetical protein
MIDDLERVQGEDKQEKEIFESSSDDDFDSGWISRGKAPRSASENLKKFGDLSKWGKGTALRALLNSTPVLRGKALAMRWLREKNREFQHSNSAALLLAFKFLSQILAIKMSNMDRLGLCAGGTIRNVHSHFLLSFLPFFHHMEMISKQSFTQCVLFLISSNCCRCVSRCYSLTHSQSSHCDHNHSNEIVDVIEFLLV